MCVWERILRGRLYCINTMDFPRIAFSWEHLGLFTPLPPFFCLGQVEGIQGGPLGCVPGSSCTVSRHESPHRIHQPGQRRALLFSWDPGCSEQDAGWQSGHGVWGHHLPHLRRPRLCTWVVPREFLPCFPPCPRPKSLPLLPWLTVLNWRRGMLVMKLSQDSVDPLGMGHESCHGVRKEETVREDKDYCIFIAKALAHPSALLPIPHKPNCK